MGVTQALESKATRKRNAVRVVEGKRQKAAEEEAAAREKVAEFDADPVKMRKEVEVAEKNLAEHKAMAALSDSSVWSSMVQIAMQSVPEELGESQELVQAVAESPMRLRDPVLHKRIARTVDGRLERER